MKFSRLQREIMISALTRHGHEKRVAPHWRVGIKGPLPSLPRTHDAELSPFVFLESLTDRENQISPAFNAFKQHINGLVGEEIESSRTNKISMEVFERLGFLYIASRKKWVQSEAETLMKQWAARGLDCFIIPELEPGADFFSGEIEPGNDIKAPLYKGRSVGQIQDKDIASQYKKAVAGLVKAGHAIQVEGVEIIYKWVGINLTRLGVTTAKSLKDTPAADIAEFKGKKLKCLNCSGTFHQTTEFYDPKRAPRGAMFDLLPKYAGAGWDRWAPDTEGENMICPECGAAYVSPETGKIPTAALV